MRVGISGEAMGWGGCPHFGCATCRWGVATLKCGTVLEKRHVVNAKLIAEWVEDCATSRKSAARKLVWDHWKTLLCGDERSRGRRGCLGSSARSAKTRGQSTQQVPGELSGDYELLRLSAFGGGIAAGSLSAAEPSPSHSPSSTCVQQPSHSPSSACVQQKPPSSAAVSEGRQAVMIGKSTYILLSLSL